MLTNQDLDRIQKEIKLLAGNIGSDSQKLLDDLIQARKLCGIYAEYFKYNEEVKNLKLPWEI